jgi:hypothetical protein
MLNVGFEWTHYDFRTEDTQPGDFDTDSVGLSLRWGFGDKEGLVRFGDIQPQPAFGFRNRDHR